MPKKEHKEAFSVMLSSDMVNTYYRKRKSVGEERKEFPAYSYQFEEYSLQEVAVLAKNDPQAGEEYLLRVNRMLYSCAQNLCNKNPYIDITYAFSQLQKVAITAIDIFDPNYGKPFVNLLRSMIKICSLSIGKTTAISYQRSMNNFGRKVEYFDCVLSDSAADGNKMAREIINRLDLEMFLETLPPDKQELLVLYSHGLTFREISEAIHVPLSTVSYWIYKLIEQAKGFFGIE